MFNLKDVPLEAADQARVRDLNDKTAGIQRMMQMFVETGERRIAELQGQGRKLFEELSEKYGLDLNHVVYQPSLDGTKLIPTHVNLGGNNAGNAR
jgi:hypothetical protein